MATLNINFTPASPAPADGYIVKYREVGTTDYITVDPNPTAPPVTITGLSGVAYEGTIQTHCGSSSDSNTIPFTVASNITPCNSGATYTGGEAFPTTIVVNLGSAHGEVTLYYDAVGIPDKFEVLYDGVTVIDTGYRGDSANQTDLDTALTTLGQPTETIAGGPTGSMSFTKSTSTTTALVIVYAPITGTSWNFTLSCPAS